MSNANGSKRLEVVQFGEGHPASAPPDVVILAQLFEAETFSELEERIRSAPNRPEAWREAGLWALAILKPILGERWPGETWRNSARHLGKPWCPPDLGANSSHTRHFARLLELALRLSELQGTPGMAKVRNALRGDRTPQRWEHTILQLEVASLARNAGGDVSLEGAHLPGRGGRKGAWPADVQIRLGGRFFALETFAVLPSETWLAGVERSDAIQERVRSLEHRYQVVCRVDFGGDTLDDPDALERFFEEIEYGAAIVAAGAQVHSMRAGRATAVIGREIEPGFSGSPIVTENAWGRIARRLNQKQQQVGAIEQPTWLRVDLLEGLWQFTQWSQAPLLTKLDLIAPQIEAALADEPRGVAGVVVSSGSAWAQGRFEDEDVAALHGRRAMRRLIEPIRVRESLIIPIRADTDDAAAALSALYARESEWLPAALKRAELPTLERIFPRAVPLPPSPVEPA